MWQIKWLTSSKIRWNMLFRILKWIKKCKENKYMVGKMLEQK